MRRLSRGFVALCLLSAAVFAPAENFDVYPFASVDEEARFDRLTHELRCPKCQNQSIADSNAPIAQDLRQRTYELVREGKSDAEVVAYLKDRYGDFITYRPPFNPVTALLWAGPFGLLFAVLAVLLLVRRRRHATAVAAVAANPEEVHAILSRYDADDGRNGDRP